MKTPRFFLLFLLVFVQLSYGHSYSTDPQPRWAEAECAIIGSGWQTVEDIEAAGGKYLVHSVGINLNNPPSDPASQLVFTIKTVVAGNYYLQARIRAPSGAQDSFWVKIDNGNWVKWWKNIRRGSQFNWNQAPGEPFVLDAGDHIITVAYRESGTQLDRIALNPSSELPSGLGGEASSCQGDESEPPVAVWREAECARVGANWTIPESAAESDEKYVVYPSGKSLNAPPTAAADQLVFAVEITQAQSYYLWARMNAPSLSSNSIWVRVDDRPWFKWWEDIDTGRGFRWNILPGGPLTLTTGLHTITVAYREGGTQLDKLSLRASTAPPSGLGEADSSCIINPARQAPVIAALSDTSLTVGQLYQQMVRAASGDALGLRVVVLGSSTAAGTGASSNQGWVDRLHNYLLTQLSNHQLFNLAVGGYTTRDVLPTGNDRHNITQALALNPSVILVNLPSNDVAKGISDEESMRNFAVLREAADAAGVPIYFTTTQPRNFGSNGGRERLASQADQIRTLFSPYVISIYDELADNNQRIKSQYSSGDGIHLNNAGHQFIFTQVRALFDTVSSQQDPIELSVSGLPAFLRFSPEGSGVGTLRGTPSAADVGTYGNMVITATQAGQSSQRTVSLTVQAEATARAAETTATAQLVLAPNPTHDYAQVMVDAQPSESLHQSTPSENTSASPAAYRLRLFSPQKKLLLDQLREKDQLHLDIRALPAGQYPLQIYQAGKLIFAEQLIVDH